MKKILIFITIVMISVARFFAQEYPRSAVLDEAGYALVQEKAVLVSRSYTNLPEHVSLKDYTPYPGNQGNYGTCTAWSTAYAARTISESEALKRKNRDLISNNAFSPAFIYKNISNDPDCQAGTSIYKALRVMKIDGASKMIQNEREMDFRTILLSLFKNTPRYRIADFVKLKESYNSCSDQELLMIKKALSEGKPIVIAINCADSFFSAKGAWLPDEDPEEVYGGHAMCLVGYDDDAYGGAFEVQNSWGTDWGNDGYIWIPYDVFERFVQEAYEIIEDLDAYQTAAVFEGSVVPKLYGLNAVMPAHFTKYGYYQLDESYPSGTKFQLYIGNKSPAYVYAFASDDTGKTNRIFPGAEANVSPILDYSENMIVYPSINSSIILDDSPGNDYLVVLYSKHPLDLDSIINAYKAGYGPLSERVGRAVGDDYIAPEQAEYQSGEINFSAKTANKRAVFSLVFVIPHKES